MENQNADPAKQYHELTKHSCQSVHESAPCLDWDNRPSPYKVYRDLAPILLARDFSPPRGDTLAAVAGSECDATKSPDLRGLSQLLFFSAGLTKERVDAGGKENYFRAAACAGALYPIEIYVVSTNLAGLEAGIYHFHPGEFSLRRLRSGDYRPELAGAAGDNQSVAAAPLTLLLSGIFWRSAWKYQARSYRYLFWDSGMILANVLAVAGSEKIACTVEMGFVDSQVNNLLGLDGEKEASLCLAPLGRSLEWAGNAVGRGVPALSYPVQPLSASEVEYPAIKNIHSASRLVDGAEVRPWRKPCPRRGTEMRNSSLVLEKPFEQSKELGEVILKRGSARRFAREGISFKQLSTLLDGSTRGIPADFLEGPETSLLDLYLVVHDVDGLKPGSYHFSPVEKTLELLREGSVRAETGYLCLEQALAADASVVVFFLSDLNRVLERFGSRGYRAAQLEAGITGGKLYLGAYSLGLGATGLTFYDNDVVKFFSPHADGKDAIFVVALGKSRKLKS